jgi:Pyruvate/2-oxoacid:ferredoxin oxidoreductase delta subunit
MQTKEEKYLKSREWVAKNPERRRELDRLFYQRNKLRLQKEDKTKTIKLRKKVEKILGKNCYLCGKYYPNRMVHHEVHCKKHTLTYNYILNHPEHFFTLCRSCHDKLHFYFRHFEKMEELKKFVRNR